MDRIDALVKLTGELFVVKNAIGHAAKLIHENEESSGRHGHPARTTRIVRAIGDGAPKRRASHPGSSLRSVFRRFPRLVREIAGSVGKTVRLITEGESTEADATIVDALFEPLLHVLRNAVDHGIEDPERRASAGKPAIGTYDFAGASRRRQVMIEVEDDGGGIDVDRVRAVAARPRDCRRRILDGDDRCGRLGLVFAAGFSTASPSTDLSGRA